MKVCVVGLGYIGFPTACLMARAGHKVVGVDISEERTKKINDGTFMLNEPGFKELFGEAKKNIVAKTSPEKADAFVICVPTPIKKDKSPDHSLVEAAAKSIAPLVEKGNLVVLESTVSPGATHKFVGETIGKNGIKPDVDFYLAHCPERAFPGNLVFELVNNDRIVGSDTEKGKDLAKALYSTFCKGSLLLADTVTAETSKLSENTYRAVNIALANELALICEKLGIDVNNVISLANRHPRVNIHSPGAGVGGHCIPVDPYFLISGQKAPLITSALKINESMPEHVALLLESALREAKKTVRNSKVVVLGAAYKPDVDDARESPTEKIIEILKARGAKVSLHDPLVRRFAHEITSDFDTAISGADAVIIATAHSAYKAIDWASSAKKMAKSPAIIDGRAALSLAPVGYIYRGIGKPVL